MNKIREKTIRNTLGGFIGECRQLEGDILCLKVSSPESKFNDLVRRIEAYFLEDSLLGVEYKERMDNEIGIDIGDISRAIIPYHDKVICLRVWRFRREQFITEFND